MKENNRFKLSNIVEINFLLILVRILNFKRPGFNYEY